MNDNILVWWILIPLFAAVGLYLIWFSRRRKKMLEVFANMHQFPIRPEYKEELQETLDRCFSLKDKNLVRSFGQLSCLIDAGAVRVFRAVELLDLNPYAKAYSTNFSRISALFSVATDYDEFFLLDKSGQAQKRLLDENMPNPNVTERVKRIASSCQARHTLSVTLSQGQGIVYFEPLVTGGETKDDIESLYCIAKHLSEELQASRGEPTP